MPEDHKHQLGRVGPELKARRQALRYSLAQVEVATKIRGKFLAALESGDYSTLPNDIYSRGFVQHYANHLGLDGGAVAAAYASERGGVEEGKTQRPKLDRPKRLVFTGTIAAVLGAILIVVGVLGYLSWQFSALAAPPQLTVSSPEADQSITGGVVSVTGKTTPGSDVSVNDSPVLTDTDGNFNEQIALQEGINTIRISSKSKLGKSTTLTRSILVKLPDVESAAAVVPASPVAGVAVAVTVSQTTSLDVVVDGVEQFRGTFISGKSRLFSGKSSVVVTTGNAGATSVAVTNSVVANKRISPLGGSGEIRRNQEFTATTVIP